MLSLKTDALLKQIKEYFVGYDELLKLLLISLLSEGHLLIEGPSGTGKTLLAKVFASSIGASFSRIQMTPDLLPGDLIGTSYYDIQSGTWKLKLGPIHANIVFVDEINRASPRAQAALLEAMQERQVSIEGKSIQLPRPFLVVATRIPYAGEGSFDLPLGEIDRFSFSMSIEGFDPEVEKEVLRRINSLIEPRPSVVLTADELSEMIAEVRNIYVSERIRNYIVSLVLAVRGCEEVDVKPSTRAPIWMLQGARALAYLKGRDYVTPDDVKEVAPYVIRHRISIRPEYVYDGVTPDDLVRRALEQVEVPKT